MATIGKRFIRVLVLIMVLMMTLGIVATPALAANDRDYYKVYVNGEETSAQAYIMADSFYMLGDEFKRIIPEAKNAGIGTNTQILISYYAEVCDYSFTYDLGRKAVYLTKNVKPTPSPTPLPQPTPQPIYAFEVYKDYVRVTTRLTIENKVIKFASYDDAKAMFGKKYKVNGLALNDWALKYGYNVFQNGMKLYIVEKGLNPFEVYVKGELINYPDVMAREIGERVFEPIVEICQALDLSVFYDEPNQLVYVYNQNRTVYFWIGNEYYKSGNDYYRMDVTPMIINDKIFIPIEYVVWSFGYKVTRSDRNPIHTISVN